MHHSSWWSVRNLCVDLNDPILRKTCFFYDKNFVPCVYAGFRKPSGVVSGRQTLLEEVVYPPDPLVNVVGCALQGAATQRN